MSLEIHENIKKKLNFYFKIQKIPNIFGLYDMSGNAYEWCFDWDGAVPTAAQTDYRNETATNSFRILRGGAWDSKADLLLVGYRSQYYPYYESTNYGFRLARSR